MKQTMTSIIRTDISFASVNKNEVNVEIPIVYWSTVGSIY